MTRNDQTVRSLGIALGAGVARFLSPCVLPLMQDQAPSMQPRLAATAPGQRSIAGFSTVSISIGACAFLLGVPFLMAGRCSRRNC